MSSLFKQGQRYYLQFYDPDRSPSRKRVATGLQYKRDAQQMQRRLDRAFQLGAYDPWTDDPRTLYEKKQPLTLNEATERYLERKDQEGCTPYTIQTYQYILERLEEQAGNKPVRDLTAADVKPFVLQAGTKAATRHKRWRSLKTFFNWCQDQEHTRHNPIQKIPEPKGTERYPRAVLPDDLEAICKALRRDYAWQRSHQPESVAEGQMVWRIPVFWFALYTGLRVSELGRLRHRDVRPGEGLIYVRQTKSRQEQTVPLTDPALQQYQKARSGAPDDYVWRAPSANEKERNVTAWRGNMSRKFTKYRKIALPDRKLTFHGLRHGFCTLLAQSGVPAYVIKEAARHSKMETSMRYVHMAKGHLRKEVTHALETASLHRAGNGRATDEVRDGLPKTLV